MNETTTGTSQQIMFHANGSYSITITAVNSIGESDHSTAIIITVEIPPVYYVPNPPTWVTTSQIITESKITVLWNPVDGATFYNVLFLKNEKNNFRLIE